MAYPYEALPNLPLFILLHLHELCCNVLLTEFGDLCPAYRAGRLLWNESPAAQRAMCACK